MNDNWHIASMVLHRMVPKYFNSHLIPCRKCLFQLLIGSMFAFLLYPEPLRAQNALDLEAKKLSDKAWKLRETDPDSSNWYARGALQISRKTRNRKIEAYSLSDIGNYFKRSEAYDSARYYLKASLFIRRNFLEKPDEISGINLLALVFRQQEIYDSAGYYYDLGLSIGDDIDNQDLKAKLLDGRGIVKLHLGDFAGSIRDINQGLEILWAPLKTRKLQIG